MIESLLEASSKLRNYFIHLKAPIDSWETKKKINEILKNVFFFDKIEMKKKLILPINEVNSLINIKCITSSQIAWLSLDWKKQVQHRPRHLVFHEFASLWWSSSHCVTEIFWFTRHDTRQHYRHTFLPFSIIFMKFIVNDFLGVNY